MSFNELFDPLIVGEPLEGVKQSLETSQIRYRVSKIDGKACILTRDYDPQRVNLVVENGIVIEVNRG